MRAAVEMLGRYRVRVLDDKGLWSSGGNVVRDADESFNATTSPEKVKLGRGEDSTNIWSVQWRSR